MSGIITRLLVIDKTTNRICARPDHVSVAIAVSWNLVQGRTMWCPHLDSTPRRAAPSRAKPKASNQVPADHEGSLGGRRFEILSERRPFSRPPVPPASMASVLVRRVCVNLLRRKESGYVSVPIEHDVQVRRLGFRLEQGDHEASSVENGEGCQVVPRQQG